VNKVPHCMECSDCREHCVIYTSLYCELKGMQICVGESIKTSPKWCPKRIIERLEGGIKSEKRYGMAKKCQSR
jgi:hypothetical protein